MWNFDIASQGYANRESYKDEKMQGHVGSCWVGWLFLLFLFILLTGGLTLYHFYLLATA